MRPRRVKGSAVRQPDPYKTPKKFLRKKPGKPTEKPQKKSFDWWLIIWVVLALAGTVTFLIWTKSIIQ